MPTREQVTRAEAVVNEYRARIGNKVRILFVVPDYFEERPKACMNGWGSVFLGVAPDGAALPCHAARSLPGIVFPNVREVSLGDIWYGSDAFNRYRGDGWMKSPCSGCSEKEKDFGGCRCQAYALTGDAENTDPACGKSPRHGDVQAVVMQSRVKQEKAQRQDMQPIVFRTDSDSRRSYAKLAP